MPFIEQVLKYNSLSIVGLEKNTGKTECLNYIISRLAEKDGAYAVSSVGIDGESIDQVTGTPKPEIFLKKGMLFTTSEKHYRERRFLCELLDIDEQKTALGRLITAKTLTNGQIILSGPSTTAMLEKWSDKLRANFGVQLCITDGALSRLSLASPAVAQAMILTTGASVSVDMPTLVRKTAFVVELIHLPLTRLVAAEKLNNYENGIVIIDKDNVLHEYPNTSSFSLDLSLLKTQNGIRGIYLTGALTGRFLKTITDNLEDTPVEIIVRDFTRFFIEPLIYKKFIAKGGHLSVLKKTELIAVCINPLAPNGFTLNSDKLRDELSKIITVPVYDLVKNGYKI